MLVGDVRERKLRIYMQAAALKFMNVQNEVHVLGTWSTKLRVRYTTLVKSASSDCESLLLLA